MCQAGAAQIKFVLTPILSFRYPQLRRTNCHRADEQIQGSSQGHQQPGVCREQSQEPPVPDPQVDGETLRPSLLLTDSCPLPCSKGICSQEEIRCSRDVSVTAPEDFCLAAGKVRPPSGSDALFSPVLSFHSKQPCLTSPCLFQPPCPLAPAKPSHPKQHRTRAQPYGSSPGFQGITQKQESSKGGLPESLPES